MDSFLPQVPAFLSGNNLGVETWIEKNELRTHLGHFYASPRKTEKMSVVPIKEGGVDGHHGYLWYHC